MKPPNHFTLVLGRKAHVSIGHQPVTLCGVKIGEHPVREGLNAMDAKSRADCKRCKRSIRP